MRRTSLERVFEDYWVLIRAVRLQFWKGSSTKKSHLDCLGIINQDPEWIVLTITDLHWIISIYSDRSNVWREIRCCELLDNKLRDGDRAWSTGDVAARILAGPGCCPVPDPSTFGLCQPSATLWCLWPDHLVSICFCIDCGFHVISWNSYNIYGVRVGPRSNYSNGHLWLLINRLY